MGENHALCITSLDDGEFSPSLLVNPGDARAGSGGANRLHVWSGRRCRGAQGAELDNGKDTATITAVVRAAMSVQL